MHQLPIEQQILLATEIAALSILCLRMWLAGLYRVYVFFFGYLVLELLQALIPVLAPLQSRLYADSYMLSEALITAFYVLVVLELYSNVLRDLPGIAGTARRYIEVTVVLAILIALIFLRLGRRVSTLIGYLLSFERTVMASLVVFVLLVAAFLAYYPIPLGRNVIAYLVGYSVWFLTNATVSLMMNFGQQWIRPLSSIAMGVWLVCLIFWIIALSRDGEINRAVVGHQWNTADQQKLRAQLDAINASLLRAGRK
jgi:hypothetical protein